jgi:hypothetical protein
MTRWNGLCALALAVPLLGAVGGCAVYGKCGSLECPEETAIRTEVEQLFAKYPELRPPNLLYVRVHDHRVTLSGQANTEYERRLAESVAREAKGVTEVVNLVGLTYSGR